MKNSSKKAVIKIIPGGNEEDELYFSIGDKNYILYAKRIIEKIWACLNADANAGDAQAPPFIVISYPEKTAIYDIPDKNEVMKFLNENLNKYEKRGVE